MSGYLVVRGLGCAVVGLSGFGVEFRVCGNSELVGFILRGGDWLTRPPSKGVAKSLPGKGPGKAE